MRETRSSGSVEGVMGDHDSYSDWRTARTWRASLRGQVAPLRMTSESARFKGGRLAITWDAREAVAREGGDGPCAAKASTDAVRE